MRLKGYSVRLSQDQIDRLTRVAAARRLTPNELARTLIEQGLEAEALQAGEGGASAQAEQLIQRAAEAAIFSELVLQRSIPSAKAELVQQLRERAKAEVRAIAEQAPGSQDDKQDSGSSNRNRAAAQLVGAV